MRFILSILLWSSTYFLQAQVEDHGLPLSLVAGMTQTNFHKQQKVDGFLEIQNEQQRQFLSLDKKLVFGKELSVSYDILTIGERSEYGDFYIYRYGITCASAISINLIFDSFFLSPNARLSVYDPSYKEIIGSHTARNNNDAEILGTELIFSDSIVVEISFPKSELGQSKLRLGTVVHGFSDLNQEMQKAIGSAGSCHYDINCALGLGWENQRNSVVCLISGGSACSGSMVNTTSTDIKPYYLSANHCGVNPTSWVFKFRWERASNHTICATGNSTNNDPVENYTINGGTLLATLNRTDMLLVKLNEMPDPSWNVYYSGWDRSDEQNFQVVTGIHHPNRDIKKISRSSNPITKTILQFNGVPDVRMWKISPWTSGSTEVGSSGSPLYNESKRIIGMLSGGTASCNGTTPNNGNDFYARFAYAWDLGDTPNTRLKEWLDSSGLNPQFIDGRYAVNLAPYQDIAVSKIEGVNGNYCGQDSLYPRVHVMNVGSETIQSFELQYQVNGTITQIPWSGTLAQYQTVEMELPTLAFYDGSYTFDAQVNLPSPIVDSDLSNNSRSSNFSVVMYGDVVDLELQFDYYASEISWEIRNSSNAIIFQSDPYYNSLNQVALDTFCLPNGCYKYIIYDTEGDGLFSGGGQNGSLTLRNSNGVLLAHLPASQANFGTQRVFDFCVDSILDIDQLADLSHLISLYPNPSSEDIHLKVDPSLDLLKVQIVDLLGKVIWSDANLGPINIRTFDSGLYLVNIHTKQGTVQKTFIKY